MSDHKCKTCELMRKVFGGKYEGCSGISKEMAEKALKVFQDIRTEALGVLKAKFDAGEITKEEFEILTENIEKSYTFAGSDMPAMVLIYGAKSDPFEMMNLVQNHLGKLISMAVMSKLQNDPSALSGLMAALTGVGVGTPPDPKDVN